MLDDIPKLEHDDPRIEQANSEGEMENYEVKNRWITKIVLENSIWLLLWKKQWKASQAVSVVRNTSGILTLFFPRF